MIEKIRKKLIDDGFDAFFVPHTDEFLSEYLTPDTERLFALSGFTGSAGIIIITRTQAVLFTDSRYVEQAAQQTDFQVFNIVEQSPVAWMKQNLKGGKVAFCSATIRASLALSLSDVLGKEGICFMPVRDNWIDLYWLNRPVSKPVHLFHYPKKYAGLTQAEKMNLVLKRMKKMHINALVVSDLESVSWLMNKRSDLSSYLPVVRHRVFLTDDGRLYRLNRRALKRFVGQTVGVDLNSIPFDLYQDIQSVLTVMPIDDPIAGLRAVKTPPEQQAVRQACLFESAVICTFIDAVYRQKEGLTELSAGQLLQKLRRQAADYLGDSFAPIVAVGSHAALAHYQADTRSDVPLNTAPMVLIDTGGQYLRGTTDMTRTLCVSTPTPVMKKRYTQVLKGHIALAQTVLQQGDTPALLDGAARQFLRADGVDYGHATGHGIGMCLSVHDKLPVIYEKSQTVLQEGMIFSNEPAFYDFKNGFGIRLENMLLTRKKGKRIFFENLIFAPFDADLIQTNLLSESERQWLRNYHLQIEQTVFPLLKKGVARRLQRVIDFFKAL